MPGGFSSITCSPASIASRAIAARTLGGAQRETAVNVGPSAIIRSMVGKFAKSGTEP
jgi:hypothetical protein